MIGHRTLAAPLMVLLAVAALWLGGCSSRSNPASPRSNPVSPSQSGGSVNAPPSDDGAGTSARCPGGLRTIVLHSTGLASRLRTLRTSGSDAAGLLSCTYRAASGRSRCSAVRVTINTAPQALVDFNRWADEAVQNSQIANGQPGLAPVLQPGIGIAADWVPGKRTFEAASEQTWVSVFLTCSDRAGQQLGLARALARVALRG